MSVEVESVEGEAEGLSVGDVEGVEGEEEEAGGIEVVVFGASPVSRSLIMIDVMGDSVGIESESTYQWDERECQSQDYIMVLYTFRNLIYTSLV